MTLTEERLAAAPTEPQHHGLAVTLQSLRLHRRSLIAWAVGLIALTLAVAAVYPSVEGQTEFEELLEEYPEALLALFGASGLVEITAGPNFMTVELFGFMVPLLLAVFGIGYGARSVAGAEERGVLELLLSYPVRRSRYVLEEALALLLGVVVLVGAQALVLVLVSPAFGLDLATSHAVAASVAVGLVGAFLGALALLVGAATGKRALALAAAAGVGVVSFLVNALAELVSWLEPLRPFSVFHYTTTPQPLISGWAWAELLVVAVATAALVGLAVAAFDRRDIHTR